MSWASGKSLPATNTDGLGEAAEALLRRLHGEPGPRDHLTVIDPEDNPA